MPPEQLSATVRTLTDRDRRYLAETLDRIAKGFDGRPDWLRAEIELLVDALEGDDRTTGPIVDRLRVLAARLRAPAGPEAHQVDALHGVPSMLESLTRARA